MSVRNWNRTYHAKEGEIEKKWYVIDANEKILGRLATRIADILRGKHKPEFTPHMDMGDNVIVINADKVQVSGKKEQKKIYYWHTMYPGGLKKRPMTEMRRRKPERVIEHAVKGMLPKNKLARKQMGHLKVYAGGEHPHEAQKPETLTV